MQESELHKFQMFLSKNSPMTTLTTAPSLDKSNHVVQLHLCERHDFSIYLSWCSYNSLFELLIISENDNFNILEKGSVWSYPNSQSHSGQPDQTTCILLYFLFELCFSNCGTWVYKLPQGLNFCRNFAWFYNYHTMFYISSSKLINFNFSKNEKILQNSFTCFKSHTQIPRKYLYNYFFVYFITHLSNPTKHLQYQHFSV